MLRLKTVFRETFTSKIKRKIIRKLVISPNVHSSYHIFYNRVTFRICQFYNFLIINMHNGNMQNCYNYNYVREIMDQYVSSDEKNIFLFFFLNILVYRRLYIFLLCMFSQLNISYHASSSIMRC